MPLASKRLLFPSLYTASLFVFAFLFAPLGFNPTDDGVVLAQTARFWSGQIPFLDFVSIRPFGSVFLHWPALMFGEYRLLASRFITVFEIGFYSYAFLSFTVNRMRIELSELVFWLLAGISFALNLHSFPFIAWTSIDAIFLVSVGVFLRNKLSSDSWWSLLAYATISMAALCRQTFLPVGLLSIWYFQDHKNWKAYLGVLLPYLLFGMYLFGQGVVETAIYQMSVSGVSVKFVLKVLLQYKGAYLGLLLGASFVLAWQWQKHRNWIWMSRLMLGLCFGLAIAIMVLLLRSNSYRYLPTAVWISIIPMIGSEMRFHRLSRHYAIGIFVLFITGLTAISIGYPSPALIMAWPWLVLVFWVMKRFTPLLSLHWFALGSFCLVLLLSAFVRLNHIYRQPASEYLQYKTKYAGLKGIWMDKHTAEALNELSLWQSHLKGKRIVLFDYAACRIASKEEMLCKGDWLTQEEFPAKALQDSLFTDLKDSKTRFWIVQKYCSAELSDTLVPIQMRKDTLQQRLLQMLTQQSIIYNEGKYFIVYRQ